MGNPWVFLRMIYHWWIFHIYASLLAGRWWSVVAWWLRLSGYVLTGRILAISSVPELVAFAQPLQWYFENGMGQNWRSMGPVSFFGMHTTDWTCINHPSLGYEGTQFWAEKDSAIPWPFRDPQDVLPLQWMPFFQRDLAQSSCDGRWMMWCQKLVRFRLVLRDQRVIQFMATLRGFHCVYALSSLMSGRYCLNYPETCFINFQKGNMAIKIDSSLESSWGPLGPLTNSAYEAHLPAPSSRCLRVWSALKIVETLGGIPSKLWSEHCLVISLKYTQFDEYMI
jgi:hypothetical protein